MNFDFLVNLFNSFYFFSFGDFDLNYVLWALFACIGAVLSTALIKWAINLIV